MSPEPSFIPPKGTKARKLLRLLLDGEQVDPVAAIYRINLPTLAARVSELRKMGWPVRSIEICHPTLEGETLTTYLLDQHFLIWFSKNPDAHPSEYPYDEGRGKFVGEAKN